MGGKILGGFRIFFLKNSSKLKKISQKRGVGPSKPSPEYALVSNITNIASFY